MRWSLAAPLTFALLAACGSNKGGTSDGAPASTVASTSGPSGQGSSGAGAHTSSSPLEIILAELRADLPSAMHRHAHGLGWPLSLAQGRLFVSTDPSLKSVAGDHDGWTGTPMEVDNGFAWVVIDVPPGSRYKFNSGDTFRADPYARAYAYDEFGEISLVEPTSAHLERWPGVGGEGVAPRELRVWVPEGGPDRVLYAHDGQNLFDLSAPFGSWRLQHAAPAGTMIVGVDNSPARIDEYTHVTDTIKGDVLGGEADAYADFLQGVVRPLVRERYGEPKPVGVMGSSLGGLVSYHIADRHDGEYAFAASLSGTMGWGSIGPGVHNETMIQRYAARGKRATVLYLDSGGGGKPCDDIDGDGIDDDQGDDDNHCETEQMRRVLIENGYEEGKDLHSHYDAGAGHDEAAWAARVHRPLSVFAGL